MINWQIVSIISFVLNVIFIVLLFFKSALNDILKEWWIDRRKKNEEKIKRLIDFKTKFNLQQSQGFLVILMLSLKQVNLIMNRPSDQVSEATYQNSLQTSSEARNDILEFVDYLPEELRVNYKRYNKQVTEIIANIMKGHCAKEDVTAYSDKMSSLASEITNSTDSILRKKLD